MLLNVLQQLPINLVKLVLCFELATAETARIDCMLSPDAWTATREHILSLPRLRIVEIRFTLPAERHPVDLTRRDKLAGTLSRLLRSTDGE